MIRMNDVTMVYDNGTRAVNKANLRIDEGEFVFFGRRVRFRQNDDDQAPDRGGAADRGAGAGQ